MAGKYWTGMAAALFMLLSGCAILAPYNQYSFDETARLKVESLRLVRKAERNYYSLCAKTADSVMAGLNSAHRDGLLRSKNKESMAQWEMLLDPSQGSLAGTLNRWQHKGTLPRDSIDLALRLIAANFDAISKLEGNKGK
jgi:hypothetical protein